MIKALAIGDNVCDVYLHSGLMYPGGQALNFSVFAKRLGADTDYMGVFGSDAVAAHVQRVLDAEGVGRAHCRSYNGENGYARVTLLEGDRIFLGSNRGGILKEYPIYLDDEDLDYVSAFDIIHTTNNGFVDGLLPILREISPMISYDFSYRWNEESRVDRVCPYIDIGFMSCSELNDGEAKAQCQKMASKGCTITVATRGCKGVIVFDGSRFYQQEPKLVDAIDTMGAGDSFAAAMIVSLLQGIESNGTKTGEPQVAHEMQIEKALDEATEFASTVCLLSGAFGYGIAIPESIKKRMDMEKK